jgi:hypothetical protein
MYYAFIISVLCCANTLNNDLLCPKTMLSKSPLKDVATIKEVVLKLTELFG